MLYYVEQKAGIVAQYRDIRSIGMSPKGRPSRASYCFDLGQVISRFWTAFGMVLFQCPGMPCDRGRIVRWLPPHFPNSE